MKEDLEVHASSGNIFEDMGRPHADEHLAKAELMRVNRTAIRERDLTRAQLAWILAAEDADVVDLFRGSLSRFSMEHLERYLNAPDMEIRIQVGPRPVGKTRAGITVEVVRSF